MGGSLSRDPQARGGHHWKHIPSDARDGCQGQHSNGDPGWSLPAKGSRLGTLEGGAGPHGVVSWRLSTADMQAALADGDGCAVSPAFAVPPAALPPACAALLQQHCWSLACGLLDGSGALAVSLRVQWLGGPSYPGTSGTAVCCDLLASLHTLPVDPESDSRASWENEPQRGQQQQQQRQQRQQAQQANSKEGSHAGGAGEAISCRVRHAFNTHHSDRGVLAESVDWEGCAGLQVELRFLGAAVHVESPLPGLVLHEDPLILKVSEDPVMLLVDGFLSPRECADVRALGGPHLRRSKVSAGDETPLRTSWGMFCTGALADHPVARHLDRKVESLTRLACRLEERRPLTLAEAIQIVRYDPGQFYGAHMDVRVGHCAKRAATVMVYLSDVEAGGATSFPRSSGYPLARALQASTASPDSGPAAPGTPSGGGGGTRGGQQAQHPRPQGLRVQPREGRAVMFWSRMADGEEDGASLHEAQQVEAGCKWIATRWCREDD